ncbi:MAG: hypothetical protein JRJ42_08630 [Deltaproteobacteria bacterium]|nr:hypothetical protein [Deltaproteobacteria bacterium]MBW2019773.1 hypothetical protein [Deltaproteobacteria bacterium]MBW2074653.1 hypothetical protein [Deltaproteobacteria bacterium]
MKILDRFFSKGVKKERPQDVMEIGIIKVIGPLIDRTANRIFTLYKTRLLTEPITYIVPAVWGAKKDGELTVTQKEIYKQVAPVIKEIFDAFQFKALNDAQAFAVGFLIRGLIISKITYMIELIKNQTMSKKISEESETDILEHLEPAGTA